MIMTRRIRKNPEHYKYIKRIAQTDREFTPFLEWYEMRRETIPEYQVKVKKMITAVMGHTTDKTHFTYDQIAEIARCSRSTISNVMSGRQQMSEELARNVTQNLKEYMNND